MISATVTATLTISDWTLPPIFTHQLRGLASA
jgi:hypothetical protein